MPHVGHVTGRRVARTLAVVTVLSALLAGCGRVAEQPVTVAAAGPAAAGPAASSIFQGSVTSVDAGGGSFVVAVWMVWAPAMEARAHDRRVLVDNGTRWDRGALSAGDLRAGEEVQVEADPAGEDWRASRVRLFDIG